MSIIFQMVFKEGVNIVKLDTDVMKFFPDAKSVNEALQTLINLMNNDQNPLKLNLHKIVFSPKGLSPPQNMTI